MLVSAAEGYRMWAPTYDATVNPLIALEERVMRDLLPAYAPPQVIDVGCGTGRWMKYFADTGSATAGVDASEEMLRSADLPGRVAVGESGNLPVANAVAGLVICSFGLSYFGSLERSFTEMARVSAVGGHVAISDMHPTAVSSGWRRSFHLGDQGYEIRQFRYSLSEAMDAAEQAGLDLVECRAAWLGEPEQPLFQRAGKPHLFAAASRMPAVWLALWKKH
ncbi:MAG TPA: class I SAM-dependent methyltransferase [Bryobacteraceae bacterium]|jgi:ubiquinone/menaquinone biosynthesis C-methylase UbiE|nr:class I SAM-dependent methyltransferase [Bryobacteraceae bacterium]